MKGYPTYEYGEFSRYNNGDGTTSCYRNLKFIGAFENSSVFTDLFYKLTKEIVDLKHELKVIKSKQEAQNEQRNHRE